MQIRSTSCSGCVRARAVSPTVVASGREAAELLTLARLVAGSDARLFQLGLCSSRCGSLVWRAG